MSHLFLRARWDSMFALRLIVELLRSQFRSPGSRVWRVVSVEDCVQKRRPYTKGRSFGALACTGLAGANDRRAVAGQFMTLLAAMSVDARRSPTLSVMDELAAKPAALSISWPASI